MDDLLQDFIAETRETLEALSGEIVAWEAHPADRARLDAIFRFVHTVKGSCGFLDLPRLERLAHAAEDALAQVRDGARTPDRALVNAVLAVVDRIGEIVEAIDAGHALDHGGEDLLIAALAEGSSEVIAAAAIGAPRTASRSVRLNVDLLDRMMIGMSEMVLARNELARRLRMNAIDPAVEAALERLSLTVGEMRDTVMRTRMQKIDALFSPLPRMVRDIAATLGKSVSLEIEGGDVELDREMIEVLRDPLVHIIRNAIDHGIEAPAERRGAGKREAGRLTVSARQSGNQIIVDIVDDGRGVDVDRLIAKLAAIGVRSERELRALPLRAQLELMFHPGLSSRDSVSEVSGRGVGMDVVKSCVDQIGGRIELENRPGHGLHIAIRVPLTLSIMSAIIVGVGKQRFAIPRQSIDEIVRAQGAAIRIDVLGGAPIATVRERRMPLLDLAELLDLPRSGSATAQMLVIVAAGPGSYALAVDSVIDNEELVIKPASPAVMATGIYAGQTLPDSGLPMLLLDGGGMARVAGLDFSRDLDEAFGAASAEPEAPGLPALLFRDLDGAHRAVPLAAVDRVEQVASSQVCHAAGQYRLTVDGRILPLAMQGTIDGRARFSVLRLKDEDVEVTYAIDEALDIIALPADFVPARVPGRAAGVALVDGEQIELLDVLWVFDAHADRATAREAPLCLIAGDRDGWMTTFVRPLLESAGYRVATALAAGEAPAVILSADASDAPQADAPVVRLRRKRQAEAGDDSVYRYDRAGLLFALEARVGAR
ncbi:chemotaxis protein CheA [Sphingomonas pokkalii]|uniref:Chemotaxis protein CheA n=1 Tax=Sphingomonas pokkalii TaxID=2175090 RepID=A0A2U0SHD4_9SPHN|nr:chemotaxis protein CheW [Sphingomonas pokkalii]PVX30772.1 chemotaxis protein CheA [Sphingomonas pokkalii]